MYLKILNIKAIERQKSTFLLVVENKFSKMGEDLYWINDDAFDIIMQFDGTKTKEDIVKTMCNGQSDLFDKAENNLNEFIEVLQNNYGIILEYIDHINKIEIPVLGTGKTQYPSAISVEITHQCNAKCLHCYGDYSCSNDFIKNTENIKKLLKEARESGTRVVEFTGGEVTCHPDFLDILDYAYKLNYNVVSIPSNGLYWREELFKLIEINREKTVVQIDLHGDNDDYVNWFMGTKINNITDRIKETILRIHDMNIMMRIVTMITPKNLEQLINIADWVYNAGIECYGLSSITPMGRADLDDKYNILLKTEEDMIKCAEVVTRIKEKYGESFLYQIKDGEPNLNNCGAFTSNPSITPNGNIKFCAMDDETLLKSFGNVFDDNIGDIYTKKYKILNMIREIPAPFHDSEECKNCKNKYFCSYCIIRGLTAGKESNFKDCLWYINSVPEEFKEMVL